MSKKIIILTSRQNFIWTSMEEIITWIEKIWASWAQTHSIQCQWINVDEMSFRDIAKNCLHADKIIVTCFNLKMASTLSGLRSKLSLDTPWIFYLHGLASFGCWPLYRWNVGELLTNNDIFIGSCQRDLLQVRVIFPEIKTLIIPFSLPLPKLIEAKKKDCKKFAFIGRISSQKNLHSLITAASLLKTDFELHFFGKEDFYGSPLMGFRDINYLKYLQDLSRQLGIEKNVFFHGFMDRLAIEEMMNREEWTFVAPSIHSDENFGMAAFRCLLNGHQVILSDWGGHADYLKYFPHQVKLLNVYQSTIGPWVSINELSCAMSEDSQTFTPFPTPDYYSEKQIQQKLTVAYHFKGDDSKVNTTSLLQTLLWKRESYLQQNKSPDGSRLYENYADPVKDPFFIAYAGAEKYLNENQNNIEVPWFKKSTTSIEIQDPHRGDFSFAHDEIISTRCGLSYFTK